MPHGSGGGGLGEGVYKDGSVFDMYESKGEAGVMLFVGKRKPRMIDFEGPGEGRARVDSFI